MSNEDFETGNVNYEENIADLISKLEGITVVGSDCADEVKRNLASAFSMRVLGAALQLARIADQVNEDVEAQGGDDPYAGLGDQHRNAMADRIERPEARFHDALPKAKYFFHQLSPRKQPSLKELCQRIEEGNPNDAQIQLLATARQVTLDQAKQILSEREGSANKSFRSNIVAAAQDVMRPPKPSENPYFTADDWFWVLEKVEHYIGSPSVGMLGQPGYRVGTGMRRRLWDFDSRLRNPNKLVELEAADQLLRAVQQECIVALETRDTADSTPADVYKPLMGTEAAMH